MPIILACGKCGGDIEVPDEAVKEALDLGQPLKPAHEVCPDSNEGKGPSRRFHITVNIYEVHGEPYEHGQDADDEEELLASFGDYLNADSFADALGPLANLLNKQWEKVQQQASIIDG